MDWAIKITKDGVQPNTDETEAVKNLPKNRKKPTVSPEQFTSSQNLQKIPQKIDGLRKFVMKNTERKWNEEKQSGFDKPKE